MNKKRGVVLLAHGARNAAWAVPFERLAASLQRPSRPVCLAFLEFMKPDLSGAASQLAKQGCTHLQLLPCFLAGAGHVLRDLPMSLEHANHLNPGLKWTVLPALGEQPDFQQALAEVCEQILERGE
ncbi:sirohydrochlorin chelatase [Inhella sp.]|uniref:sirohydrochlorin chelatase n=1 Tax=Inhella sp. TaxID=1921806 RepID=UPI0035AEEE9F